MILEFNVGYNIYRKTKNSVTDTDMEYYKCKFYIDKDVWEDAFLSIVFMTQNNDLITIELGPYNDILMCVIPPKIINQNYLTFYIRSENRKTNTIALSLNNIYITQETVYTNNIIDNDIVDTLIEERKI